MRKFLFPLFLWLTVLFTGPALQAESDLQIKLTGSQVDWQNNAFVFQFQGTTNLPDDSRLEGFVFYAKKITLPESWQKETGKKYEIEHYLMDKGVTEVQKGRFKLDLGFLKRQLYSGDYLFRIRFNPAAQIKMVRNQLPPNLKPIEQEVTTIFGDPAELANEKETTDRDIYRDLEKIQHLYRDLNRTIDQYQKLQQVDSKQWAEWQTSWRVEIDQLKAKNKSRFEERIYWMESAAKYSLNLLCAELTLLANNFTETNQNTGLAKAHESFQIESKEFLPLFTDQLYTLGFQKIIDKPRVNEILAAIREDYRILHEFCLKSFNDPQMYRSNEWLKKTSVYQTKIITKLFELMKETPDYTLADHTLPLSQAITKYFHLISEGSAASVKKQKQKIEVYFEKLTKSLRLNK